MLLFECGGEVVIDVNSLGGKWSGRRPAAWLKGSALPCSDSQSSRSSHTFARWSTSASTWYENTRDCVNPPVLFLFFECMCVLSGDGSGWSLQCGRWASSPPPQPLPVPSAALQHGCGPTGRPADPGRPQLHSASLGSSAKLALHWLIFFTFCVPGLEGGLSSQPCDLTFHQSGEKRGDAAEPAHSFCAHCGLWKQR